MLHTYHEVVAPILTQYPLNKKNHDVVQEIERILSFLDDDLFSRTNFAYSVSDIEYIPNAPVDLINRVVSAIKQQHEKVINQINPSHATLFDVVNVRVSRWKDILRHDGKLDKILSIVQEYDRHELTNAQAVYYTFDKNNITRSYFEKISPDNAHYFDDVYRAIMEYDIKVHILKGNN